MRTIFSQSTRLILIIIVTTSSVSENLRFVDYDIRRLCIRKNDVRSRDVDFRSAPDALAANRARGEVLRASTAHRDVRVQVGRLKPDL